MNCHVILTASLSQIEKKEVNKQNKQKMYWEEDKQEKQQEKKRTKRRARRKKDTEPGLHQQGHYSLAFVSILLFTQ